ncbi:MAG TPA: NAD(P)-dependent oxidoreductase [Candidatus Latescibacteria bacterium]|nr:NAD(P)-dependent oxidoreductase [Candidatus Latescibacterota bacterium]
MNIVVFGAAGWLGRAILAQASGRSTVRAFDRGPDAWAEWRDVDGDWTEGEIVHGDIADYPTVARAVAGMDAVIHTAVFFPKADEPNDPRPFLINLKGMWNVLEAARLAGIRRVVHVGSCGTIHPQGLFYDATVRRAEGDLYGVCKRLQEEMCRQYHEAHGMSTVVLRPDYIVDSRLGIGRFREKLGQTGSPWRLGWVCRYDLAEACLLAAENPTIEHEILHIVGTPGAEKFCNVARAQQVLGLEFKGDLERFRDPAESGRTEL